MGIIIVVITLIAMVVILLLMAVILPEKGNLTAKEGEKEFKLSEGEESEE